MKVFPVKHVRTGDGFTLIEMMVAIAIIGILSAIVIPNYISHRNNQQVSRAAREIYSALQSAKMTAIRENTAINVLFTPGAGDSAIYQIYEDENDNGAFDAGEEIRSGQMPPGITMQSAGFAGIANSTRFTRLGLTTGENGTVIVTNGNLTARVVVNTAGGIRVN